MAIQTVTVTLSASATASFTFSKPSGNYGKNPGVNISDGVGGATPWFISPDVDNGDGTMTGTINLTGPVTGTVEIEIFDKP